MQHKQLKITALKGSGSLTRLHHWV